MRGELFRGKILKALQNKKPVYQNEQEHKPNTRISHTLKLVLGNSRPNAPLTSAAPLTGSRLKPTVGSSIHAN